MPHQRLSPVQQDAFESASKALRLGLSVSIWGSTGVGKSTVLAALHDQFGGALFKAMEFVDAAIEVDPLAIEDAIFRKVATAIKNHDYVIVDDLELVSEVLSSTCGNYPRNSWCQTIFEALLVLARYEGTLLVTTYPWIASSLSNHTVSFDIDRFEAEDYSIITSAWMGEEVASEIDFVRIHRFARRLNGHQLKAASLWLRDEKPDTERLIKYLRSQSLASNVNVGEVSKIELSDLVGCEDIVRQLERHIVFPLENEIAAEKYELKPKRGVLLHGPPGTGKTSVGRALARRLKGKFFLIDGTCISGSSNFYDKVHRIFESARENSPAIIFIDDADVIFRDSHDDGLYRYLLTMLDGLESEGASRVCVMMTAMYLKDLPAALVRSGRVELWLETSLPDSPARKLLIQRQVRDLPSPLNKAEVADLVDQTDSFSAADLISLLQDAKGLVAYDEAQASPLKSAKFYFDQSLADIRKRREAYLSAEERPSAD